jgi:DNA/RNA-binding protein KIN17
MLEGGTKLKIDQSFLETVIPAIGGHVKIVNGHHVGRIGILESVDFENFKARVSVDGEKLTKEYEHICKFM